MSERMKFIESGLANYPRMDKAGPPSIGGVVGILGLADGDLIGSVIGIGSKMTT